MTEITQPPARRQLALWKRPAAMTEQDLSLTDRLALDRTHLANQRTILAFTRTGLYLVFTGIGIFQLVDNYHVHWLGGLALGLGLLAWIVGVVNYVRMKRRISRLYR